MISYLYFLGDPVCYPVKNGKKGKLREYRISGVNKCFEIKFVDVHYQQHLRGKLNSDKSGLYPSSLKMKIFLINLLMGISILFSLGTVLCIKQLFLLLVDMFLKTGPIFIQRKRNFGFLIAHSITFINKYIFLEIMFVFFENRRRNDFVLIQIQDQMIKIESNGFCHFASRFFN